MLAVIGLNVAKRFFRSCSRLRGVLGRRALHAQEWRRVRGFSWQFGEALLHKSNLKAELPLRGEIQAIRTDCGRASSFMWLSTSARIATSVAWEPTLRAHRE